MSSGPLNCSQRFFLLNLLPVLYILFTQLSLTQVRFRYCC